MPSLKSGLKSAWLCMAAALALGGACAEAGQPSGNPPQRIISLLPSATETVCALGACDRLVGVDEFSQDPPQVRNLPQLGKTWQPDLERIVQLRPDGVLVGKVPGVIERLQAAGIPYLVADASTVEEVHAMLFKVDALLQTQRAEPVWQGLQARLDEIAQTQQGQAAQRVYLEVDPAMFAAGPHSFMGQLLKRLVAINIAPSEGPAFMRLSPEFVLRAEPDLIIVAHHGESLRKLVDRPGWPHMRAMQPAQRDARVCQLSQDDSRRVTRPGPNFDEAARIFNRCLQRVQAMKKLP